VIGRRNKAPEVLGIHVGRETLTIARVAKRNGDAELLQLAHEPLTRDPGGWPVELVAEKLRKAKKTVNLRAEEAKITLSSDLAPTCFFVMPPMKGEQLDEALKLQLHNKWGNSGSELSYDFDIVEKRGERCRIFAPSIPTERLRLILGSFLDVNCMIDWMEVEGVSLANLLVYVGLAGAKPVGALHVGSNWAEIHIVRRKRIVLSRPIDKLENESSQTDNATQPRAQAGAHGTEAESPGPSSSYMGRVAREANKTLDYFEIELLSPAVERLILVGQTADSARLPGFLAEELELEVDTLDTGQRIHDATGQYQPNVHGLAVAAAIGEG